MENFFDKLFHGDFKEAISRLNLRYTPSNTDNRILHELMREGLAPVFVQIQNTSSETRAVSERQFYLIYKGEKSAAFKSDQLPDEFKRFDAGAFFADTANVAGAVIATAALYGIIAIASGGKSASGAGFAIDPSRALIMTEKTTKINFKDFLISSKSLAPNESISGLLFFQRNKSDDQGESKLLFDEILK